MSSELAANRRKRVLRALFCFAYALLERSRMGVFHCGSGKQSEVGKAML